MDLRAITDLEGGRLQSDVGSQNDPWDPGVPVAQRQAYASAPAPPTTPADGHERHKDRGEVMHRVSKSKHPDANRCVGASDEDEAEPPFVPHHALSDPRSHHPSDPLGTHLGHTSGMHAASRARQIAAHHTHRVNSDRDPSMGINTTSTHSQMVHRRARPEDHEDDEDERERYRSRPRRLDVESGLSLKRVPLHSPPKFPPRHRSPPSAQSPDSDSASSQPPTIAQRTFNSSPRRYPGGDSDPNRPDLVQFYDENETQRFLTRGEYHPPEAQLAHQIHGFAQARSSSMESTDEWDQDTAPPQSPSQSEQKNTPAPPVSPVPAPSTQPADAGSLGMLSDSELADETVHLRALLGCPPGAPVGLDALADPPLGEKPNYPLPTLIKLAIYGSPRRRLTLQEIYQALEDRFEWFRQRTDELSWKNSIRHNLSLRKCFLKVQRPITEPGKGSYWMIDLTQGEGNKRVRKRNKKPTKGQLAAQAATEAYRASSRLPGQGDGLRPVPYPMPPHLQPQPQIVEDPTDDMYQAPPMQTNFTPVAPVDEPHHTLLRSSSSQHKQPSGISPHQRQRTEQQYPLTSTDHTPMALHQNDTQPLPSSHDTLGQDTNIDPMLRVLSKDSLGSHAVAGPMTASHHDIIPHRGGPTPNMQPGTVLLPMPLSTLQQHVASANRQAQLTLPQLSLAPSRSAYHHQLASYQGAGLDTPQSISTPHMPQHSPSSVFRHQELQSTSTLPQSDTLRQMAPPQQTAFTHAHVQAPRLPPMRTLSESPAPATPLPQQPVSALGSVGGTTAQGQRQGSTAATGFARFGTRGPARFANPTFGKPTLVDTSPPVSMPVRPPLVSEDRSQGHTDGEGGTERDVRAGGDDERHSGSGGSRRHFVPPSPRLGIEYVQRTDGGLITARRTSGRHDSGTVEWLSRLDHGHESRGVGADPPPPIEDMS